MIITLILACLFLLLLVGVLFAFALGGMGSGMLVLGGFSPLLALQSILSTLDQFILLAVPLFLLMSNLLLKGDVGHDLFAAVQAWVGHWRGGLAVATIISCGLFAAILGASVANAATIGTVAIPEMINRGYEKRFVYGFVPEQSVIALFLAGIGPGLLLVTLFIAFAILHARLSVNFEDVPKASMSERIEASKRALPSVELAALMIIGLYSGAFTPTLAAAVHIHHGARQILHLWAGQHNGKIWNLLRVCWDAQKEIVLALTRLLSSLRHQIARAASRRRFPKPPCGATPV
ncbi:MAG: TRAP transporter large permease subunit [Aliishimia sp.]